MKRFVKYSLLGFGAAIIFLTIIIFCLSYFLGTHTKYCPLGHKISDTSACVVLDRDVDRILIQHADLDINVYSLEIIEGNKSSFFKFPPFIHQLAPNGYTASLIKNENDTILIDGSRYSLEPT